MPEGTDIVQPELKHNAPAIEVHNLDVTYGTVRALSDVNFSLMPARICGLVGMNGAGKSTLFKTLVGVAPFDSGTIKFFGQDATTARKTGLIGYVPQHDDIDTAFPLSVYDVVMMGRYGYQNWLRRPGAADKKAVGEAIERVELSQFRNRQIGDLSGGQRKRVFVARALAQQARLLLLDEPFGGVDKRSQTMITEVLHELARNGATALVATHDLHTLPQLCAETILINRTVLMHNSSDEVLRPDNLARAFDLPAAHLAQVSR